ncbi:hypothetical protein B7463_g2884, partial [Scytalidium lignicola]
MLTSRFNALRGGASGNEDDGSRPTCNLDAPSSKVGPFLAAAELIEAARPVIHANSIQVQLSGPVTAGKFMAQQKKVRCSAAKNLETRLILESIKQQESIAARHRLVQSTPPASVLLRLLLSPPLLSSLASLAFL